ncbi:MAG: hypothetical protein ISEC1_P0821 [Thiomicrorhabdus sp.]|nr:MAG: hypothetical protein ISEC1_P0821 [Thiomicrorhabdus sp.]
MKYFFPMVFLQWYLTVTLLMFAFGPIDYHVELPFVFWSLLILYQLAFLVGYYAAFMIKSNNGQCYKKNTLDSFFSNNRFRLLVVAAMIASIIGFKGSESILDLLNPLYWFDAALSGIQSPGQSYVEKMQRVDSDVSGNKLASILLFIFAFSKILLIPALVFFWDRIGYFTRSVAFFVTLLPVLSALSHGTNKYVFDFAIFYSASLIVFFIQNYYSTGRFGFKKRKFFVLIFLTAGVGAFTFFGLAMQERGGSVTYIEAMSPLGDIMVKDPDSNGDHSFVYVTYAWLSSYIVQGYYGFSLSLTQDFTSSFGLGNSTFLMRQFEWISGVDLSTSTYQHKIDRWWGESAQWHSFYSHFANDFHFVGVAFICLILGFYLAKLWFSIIDNNNFYAAAMMPLFALLIIFIPANNQIFGFLETFSAFIIISMLWFYTMYINRHEC